MAKSDQRSSHNSLTFCTDDMTICLLKILLTVYLYFAIFALCGGYQSVFFKMNCKKGHCSYLENFEIKCMKSKRTKTVISGICMQNVSCRLSLSIAFISQHYLFLIYRNILLFTRYDVLCFLSF